MSHHETGDRLSHATRVPAICDSCFDAYQGIANDPDDDAETVEVAAQFMGDFGADVPDHVCDATDEPDIACDCGCKS